MTLSIKRLTFSAFVHTDGGVITVRVTPVWPAALRAMGVIMEFPELPPGLEID